MPTTGKSLAELTQLVDDALRSQPGCETARVPTLSALPDRSGRNWEILMWCSATVLSVTSTVPS